MKKNQKPKKILEISSYPPPRAGWGVRVAFVKEALIEAGHTCEVINIAPESRRIPSPEYLTSRNGLDYAWKIFTRSIRGYRVHMHLNGNSPKGFVLTILAEALNLLTLKRPVLTLHAGPDQLYFPRQRAPYLIPMFKFIFGAARKIICNSNDVKEKIAEYGINPDKIVPIPAFSRQYLRFEAAHLNGTLLSFLESKELLISSYVFFRPEFFIDRMVRGFAELHRKYPESGLLILGSDDGSQEIKKLAQDLGISGHVYFTGDLDHDAFLTVVSRSHIVLRTPIRDGVSSSVLEALALNIPVVASENGRRPESVITYNHEDISDMVRALEETIDNLPEIKKRVVKPHIRDTVADEVAVLTEV